MGEPQSEIVTVSAARDEAVDRLAKILVSAMERWDPTPGGDWDNLRESEREFYRGCVREICLHKQLVLSAISSPPT